jgi:predicted secreted Zn-dependent protease
MRHVAGSRSLLSLSLVLAACAPAQIPQASLSAAPAATSTPGPSATASQLPALYKIIPVEAPAGIRLTQRDITYSIAGETPSELRLALSRSGLVDATGAQSAALTNWHVRWAYSYGADPSGDCALSRIRVSLRVTITMPVWEPPASADPDLVESWGRYENALTFHERGHAQNGLDAAAEISAALRSMEPSACDRLEAIANATAYDYLAEGQHADRAYDRATEHGATQGADPSLLTD